MQLGGKKKKDLHILIRKISHILLNKKHNMHKNEVVYLNVHTHIYRSFILQTRVKKSFSFTHLRFSSHNWRFLSVNYTDRMTSDGLRLQRLEAGSRFHDQRFKPGHSSESTGYQPQDHESQWLVTRPWFVCFVELNFNKETESSETSIYQEGKKVHVNSHTWACTENCAFVVVCITYMGHFFWVFCGQSSCFA